MLKLEIELDLGRHDVDLLFKTLGCNEEEELQSKLSQISKAATSEYLDMILGKQLPTRANEIYERRLYHLLKNYYAGKIPSEADVATLFQFKISSSKTLLRNVRTKFKYDLEEEIMNTVQDTLEKAEFEDDHFIILVQCENILEELQQTVSINAPQLDQITKVKGSAGVYKIPEDTFELLAKHYGINSNIIRGRRTRK